MPVARPYIAEWWAGGASQREEREVVWGYDLADAVAFVEHKRTRESGAPGRRDPLPHVGVRPVVTPADEQLVRDWFMLRGLAREVR